MNCIHEYERPMICDNLMIISFLKDTLDLKVFEYPKLKVLIWKMIIFKRKCKILQVVYTNDDNSLLGRYSRFKKFHINENLCKIL